MLISLIVTNGENFKEIEELSLAALGNLEWNDPFVFFPSWQLFPDSKGQMKLEWHYDLACLN